MLSFWSGGGHDYGCKRIKRRQFGEWEARYGVPLWCPGRRIDEAILHYS